MTPVRRVDQVGRIARQDAEEDRVPAAGPAEARDRAEHLRHELGRARIIGLGDGAELHCAECLRGPLLHFGDAFRIDAVARRQRIAHRERLSEKDGSSATCASASAPTFPASPLPIR